MRTSVTKKKLEKKNALKACGTCYPFEAYMPSEHCSHFAVAFIGRHHQGRGTITVLEVDGGTPLEEELRDLFTVLLGGLWGSTATQRARTRSQGAGGTGPFFTVLIGHGTRAYMHQGCDTIEALILGRCIWVAPFAQKPSCCADLLAVNSLETAKMSF